MDGGERSPYCDFMTSVQELKWRQLQLAGPDLHVNRAFYPARYAFQLHTHDFPELAVIEAGRGRHLCNGATTELREHDILCIHPDDQHCLAAGDESLVFVNIAFSAELSGRLAAQGALHGGAWPWHRSAPRGLSRQLHGEDRTWLSLWLRELEARPQRSPSAAALFLLDLARRLGRTVPGQSGTTAPAWLCEALEGLDAPERLREGLAGLTRRSGRSREHLNRLIRAHFGCTAIALLSARRMAYAARALVGREAPSIPELAQTCGYDSASHFHARFRGFYRCTPHEFRRRRAAAEPA